MVMVPPASSVVVLLGRRRRVLLAAPVVLASSPLGGTMLVGLVAVGHGQRPWRLVVGGRRRERRLWKPWHRGRGWQPRHAPGSVPGCPWGQGRPWKARRSWGDGQATTEGRLGWPAWPAVVAVHQLGGGLERAGYHDRGFRDKMG